MSGLYRLIVACCVALPLAVKAQVLQSAISLPISHPVANAELPRSIGTWRSNVGAWGEGLVCEQFKLRGYEVYQPKVQGNKGIDAIVLKRNALGEISEIRIVEVKTRNGYGKPVLGQTQHGEQMSRRWLNQKLRTMRASGDPELKKLALEISKFRRRTGQAIETLGEVYEVNPRLGEIIARNPVTGAEIHRQDIKHTMNALYKKAKAPQVRKWAADQLASLDAIRSTRMSNFVGQHSVYPKRAYVAFSNRASKHVGAFVNENALAIKLVKMSPKVVGRLAGPVGVAVGLYMDGKDFYDVYEKYQSGTISKSEFHIQLSRTGGGMSGATAGFIAGAALGATFGAPSGPGAMIASLVGGSIGAGLGYWAGAQLAEGAAQFYVDLGQAAREHNVDRWIQQTTYSAALEWNAGCSLR